MKRLDDILTQDKYVISIPSTLLAGEASYQASTNEDFINEFKKVLSNTTKSDEVLSSVKDKLDEKGLSIDPLVVKLVLNALSESEEYPKLVITSDNISKWTKFAIEGYLSSKKILLSKGFGVSEKGIGEQRFKFRHTNTFDNRSIPLITLRSVVDRDTTNSILRELATTEDKKLVKRLKAAKFNETDKAYVESELIEGAKK